MAGEEITKVSSKEEPPCDDDLDQQFAAYKAKQTEKFLKAFPKRFGPHEKKVKHPSELHPNWASWSLEKKLEKQKLYETYVDNWYKGNGGKPFAEAFEYSEEDEAALIAAYKKSKAKTS